MLRGQFIVAAAAIYLLLVGALCLFLPEKVGAQFGAGANAPLLLIQVLGSACLGLGLLDWVSRHSMVGGIYGRPLVIGNLVHFVCGALVFARSLMDAQTAMTWIGLAVYSVFAIAFGALLLGRGISNAPPK